MLRIGWSRTDVTCRVDTPHRAVHTSKDADSVRWLRVKSSAQHSELLLAGLHVAASHFGLCGCIGARIGRAVSSVDGIIECSRTFVWWWHTDRPQQYWYFQSQGNGRIKLTDIFGRDDWSRCSVVYSVMAADDDVEHIRRSEPGIPNVGGLDGPLTMCQLIPITIPRIL